MSDHIMEHHQGRMLLDKVERYFKRLSGSWTVVDCLGEFMRSVERMQAKTFELAYLSAHVELKYGGKSGASVLLEYLNSRVVAAPYNSLTIDEIVGVYACSGVRQTQVAAHVLAHLRAHFVAGGEAFVVAFFDNPHFTFRNQSKAYVQDLRGQALLAVVKLASSDASAYSAAHRLVDRCLDDVLVPEKMLEQAMDELPTESPADTIEQRTAMVA